LTSAVNKSELVMLKQCVLIAVNCWQNTIYRRSSTPALTGLCGCLLKQLRLMAPTLRMTSRLPAISGLVSLTGLNHQRV